MDRGITQERLSRLPRWAVDEITRLDRENRRLRGDIEQMKGEVGDTNTYADPHRRLMSPTPEHEDLNDKGLPLRRDVKVRFHIGTGYWVDVQVEGDDVLVMTEGVMNIRMLGSNRALLRGNR